MLSLDLFSRIDASRKVLFLGAHGDDIEIGCGGTVLRLFRERPDIEAFWVVFGARGARGKEAKASAGRFLRNAHGATVVVRNFRDGFFPYDGAEIKEEFERLKAMVSPDLIFTHARNDLHQDHRTVSELTFNTFRDHLILEYEIPKYDGDLGAVNGYVTLDESSVRDKVRFLMKGFPTQAGKPWFDEETFRSIMRLRGIEARAPHGYAEGFYCKKFIL